MTRRSGKKNTPTGVLTSQLANKTESLGQAAEALKESDIRFKTIVQTSQHPASHGPQEADLLHQPQL